MMEGNDLHDARLAGVEFLVKDSKVAIYLEAYRSADAAERVYIKLEFSDVINFNAVAVMSVLKSHHGAGNVNYYVREGRVSFLYLSGGIVAVESSSPPNWDYDDSALI